MTILAITPYAGSKKLVTMTDRMLKGFAQCALQSNQKIVTVAVNNKAETIATRGLMDYHLFMEENVGFGNAINFAIKSEVFDPLTLKFTEGDRRVYNTPPVYSDVLILNNDLEFPHTDWLVELLKERDGKHVICPTTDITATQQAVQDGPKDLNPFQHREVSAYCWLVPLQIIRDLRKKFGFNLFHSQFSNYGSDDVTAACLRKMYGPHPFKVVPRSWVRHLKAQTANELGVKAGTDELLRAIRNYKRARQLN